MGTQAKIEAKTVAASMSADTPAQWNKYQALVKEFAAKVDAGLLTVDEAAYYVNARA